MRPGASHSNRVQIRGTLNSPERSHPERTKVRGRTNWKAALEHVKGVYLISDKAAGRRYVGSAYGQFGIWSRWENYVVTGHGGNSELMTTHSDLTMDYVRKNFQFALLEHRSVATPDDVVIKRETFWKKVLLTRGDYGLNRN